MSKKHKRFIIPKNRDIEDIVYKDTKENEKKDRVVKNAEEQRKNFVSEIKVETTGLYRGAAKKRHERIIFFLQKM